MRPLDAAAAAKAGRPRRGAAGARCAVLSLGLAAAVSAAPARAAAPAAPTVPTPERRSYLQHSYTSPRPGSKLMFDNGPWRPADLRSALQLRRDAELVRHYGRLGQLDVLFEALGRATASGLQEKVDTVRRSETQRYYAAMQNLRALILRKLAADAG